MCHREKVIFKVCLAYSLFFHREIFTCVHITLRGDTHMQTAGASLPLRPRYIKVCIRHWMMMVLCKYKKEAPPRTLGVTLGDQRPAAERGARASESLSFTRSDANGAHYCWCRCHRGSLTCDLLQMSNRSHYYYYYDHCVAPWKIHQIRLRERSLSARAARRSGYNLTNFTVSLRAASIFALRLCARIIPALVGGGPDRRNRSSRVIIFI